MSKAKEQYLAAARLEKAETFTEFLDSLGVEWVSNNNGIHVRIYKKDSVINIWPTAEKLHVVLKGNRKYTPDKVILGSRYIANYIEEIANEL
jgi:hypothetical protein